jgi:hypothetical protein
MTASNFPIFKVIKLGICKTLDRYRTEMRKAGHCISATANDILGSGEITFALSETEVDLVKLSVADLGFKGVARYSEICESALEVGFLLCPAEVGPALRLTYNDQPRGEWLVIGMQTIPNDRDLFAFGVGHEGGLWLDTWGGHPGDFWSHIAALYLFGLITPDLSD